jgi:hypothetical protein
MDGDGDLVFLGVIVWLAEVVVGGIPGGLEGTTDGVTVGEGLQAASRRMMVTDIFSFFGYIFYLLLDLLSADRD